MKGVVMMVICAALTAFGCRSNVTEPDRPRLTIETLNNEPVIGALGVPLGTPVEIEAIVVAGRDLNRKGWQGKYLLNMTKVGTGMFCEPRYMEFRVPGIASLARDPFDLHLLKTGEMADRLNDEEISKLEKGYVGKRVRLLVYEVGEFGGIPNQLPKDVAAWQGYGFSFHTSLEVAAERAFEDQPASFRP